MSNHNPPKYWAAAAFGLALLLFSTPAYADNMGKMGEGILALLLLTGAVNIVLGLGLLIPVAIMGRRSAPQRPWKVTVAVLGIVGASLLTAWNLMVAFVTVVAADVVTKGTYGGEQEVAVLLALGLLPLVLSACAIIFSAILYSRNKRAATSPAPYPPSQYPPQQYG